VDTQQPTNQPTNRPTQQKESYRYPKATSVKRRGERKKDDKIQLIQEESGKDMTTNSEEALKIRKDERNIAMKSNKKEIQANHQTIQMKKANKRTKNLTLKK
jgi:hypothetical protein